MILCNGQFYYFKIEWYQSINYELCLNIFFIITSDQTNENEKAQTIRSRHQMVHMNASPTYKMGSELSLSQTYKLDKCMSSF